MAITGASLLMNATGIAFLILKTVSVPFLPNRNIDNMSDYYTAVWESIKRNARDDGRITVIDITENSRKEIATILSIINDMEPQVIGLDVTNSWEEDKSTDSIFVSTIKNISNIVLPVEYYNYAEGEEHYRFSTLYGHIIDKEYGVVSFPNNRGILRQYQPVFKDSIIRYDAFGCAIANKLGLDISNIREKSRVLINYTTLNLSDDYATPGDYVLNLKDSLSYNSFLSDITGRVILIGSTRLKNDQHLTPLGYSLSGVMIHAHIVSSLISGKTIRTVPNWLRYLICLIISVAILALPNRVFVSRVPRHRNGFRILLFIIVFLAAMVLFSGIGTYVFCHLCYYIDFAPYIVVMVLLYLFKKTEITKKI